MSEFSLSVPVALFIFNRPLLTARVFDAIVQAKPRKLFIIADGPRDGRDDDRTNCVLARKVVERIDWECDVCTDFSDINMGCRQRVSSGLNWVFDNVEEAIILEDDCVPHQTFFRFCQEMLGRYRNDQQVMQVCGSNLLGGWRCEGNESYFFSKYGPIWGWATWLRAWKLYDVEMKRWPEVKQAESYYEFCESAQERNLRVKMFDAVYGGKLDTWDHQWTFAKLTNGGLNVVPHVNLVTNAGFGPDSTNTKSRSVVADLPVEPILFPLRHPATIARNVACDKRYSDLYVHGGLLSRLKRLISSIRCPG